MQHTSVESGPMGLDNKRAALEAVDVHKSLPVGRESVEILKGISLRVSHGAFVALVGPSGSGKSTFLSIMAGLDSPTSGQVLVDGQDITHLREAQLATVRNQKIGMVYQAFNLIPTLTVLENVEAPLYAGRHPGSARQRSKQLLDLVGLGHRLSHRPSQLSGGEQQRVAIARALVTNPAVVVMDEPTGNLDQPSGEVILNLLHQIRAHTGATLVIATHDRQVAGAADREYALVDGRIRVATESSTAEANHGAERQEPR